MITSRTEITGADVAGHYDELDAFYCDVWGEHVHHGLWLRGDESRELAVRQLCELVANEAGVTAGTRVVDIGCGYGATARLLAAERDAEVTGITISPAQFAIARRGDSSSVSSSASLPREKKTDEDEDTDEDEELEVNPAPSSDPAPVFPSPFALRPSPFLPPRFLLGDWLDNELPAAAFDAAIAVESSEHMPDKPRFFAEAYRVLRPGGCLVICAWLAAENPTPRQARWLIEPICREGRVPQLGSESDYRQLAADAGFTVERFQDVTAQIARTWPAIVRIFLGKLATRPAYLRFLFNRHARNRVFALTILRLWIAFRTGAMRYGVFTLVKD